MKQVIDSVSETKKLITDYSEIDKVSLNPDTLKILQSSIVEELKLSSLLINDKIKQIHEKQLDLTKQLNILMGIAEEFQDITKLFNASVNRLQ